MKLELLRDEEEARPGFTPVRGDFHHLDDLVEDAEATEIIANDIIDLQEDPAATLSHWARKLRRGGTLTIGGLDFQEVCRRVGERRLIFQEAVQLTFGDDRRSVSSPEMMSDAMEALGLVVISQRFEGYHYSVTARRP